MWPHGSRAPVSWVGRPPGPGTVLLAWGSAAHNGAGDDARPPGSDPGVAPPAPHCRVSCAAPPGFCVRSSISPDASASAIGSAEIGAEGWGRQSASSMLGLTMASWFEQRHPLQEMAQLAHIARPPIAVQPCLGRLISLVGRAHPMRLGRAAQELLGHEEEISAPLAQRG